MTQENKELLLKDLSARLSYHVKVKVWLKDGTTEEGFLDLEHNYADVLRDAFYYNKIKDIKPYLFPLSSMTEKQRKELEDMHWSFDNFEINNVYECFRTYREYVSHSDCFTLIDWCNKNNFDYRGLIPLGLAKDATGLNIY